ncbi:hypothetical protein CABS01_05028 [Colletotrichum abscissum]|uniref:Uncharacterized protein n=1 Tax=Colletotrichum abscissum TaxID=1671311 RepID=A0A9P9X0C5_9PEZI|nr:uncharacterized protein CABS01_05028 [Colletotrichum abscissum]KAI3529277.1 hypothetical protein CABS02_14880 [Colletotrichum abscissum]KAK1523407.1 hypothetical protein CABS01_05028 [Colletotrichum abscissum]
MASDIVASSSPAGLSNTKGEGGQVRLADRTVLSTASFAGISRSTIRRGKLSPADLPREIFLSIIDAYLENALADNRSVLWVIDYHHDAPTKLVLRIRGHNVGSEMVEMSELDRFQSIRLPLQIDKKTRSMVHRHFRRMPVKKNHSYYSPLSAVDAWVRPDVDLFTPDFNDTEGARPIRETKCSSAIQLPTPLGHDFLSGVQHVFLPTLRFFQKNNKVAVAAMSTLPSLQTVSIIAGYSVPMYDDPELLAIHPGWMKVEGHRYPDMKIWEERHGRAFRKLWLPFKRREIELFAFRDDIKPAVMEMKITKDGIRVKHLFPDCFCCPSDLEYNDKES